MLRAGEAAGEQPSWGWENLCRLENSHTAGSHQGRGVGAGGQAHAVVWCWVLCRCWQCKGLAMLRFAPTSGWSWRWPAAGSGSLFYLSDRAENNFQCLFLIIWWNFCVVEGKHQFSSFPFSDKDAARLGMPRMLKLLCIFRKLSIR